MTAYAGAAPLIKNKTYISPAAGILAVEAYHGGIIRSLLYQNKDTMTPYNMTVAEVIQGISTLRDVVDGASDDDQGITMETANGEEANLVPANANGLVYTRSPAQVLDIVTLGKGQSGGGFFPNGLNGYFSAANAAATEGTS